MTTSDIRPRPRIGRILIFLAIALGVPAVLTWPWDFVPVRWRHPLAIRSAEKSCARAEHFKQVNGRYPTHQEMPELDALAFREKSGGGFTVTLTEGFDSFLVFDSATREWR